MSLREKLEEDKKAKQQEMMQIKLFLKDGLGFESKVNEFLKQIHVSPT
jgi:hypothetical protein